MQISYLSIPLIQKPKKPLRNYFWSSPGSGDRVCVYVSAVEHVLCIEKL